MSLFQPLEGGYLNVVRNFKKGAGKHERPARREIHPSIPGENTHRNKKP